MAQGNEQAPRSAGGGKGAAAKLVAVWIFLPLFYFVTGGSLAWWEAWAYCAVLLVPMTAFLVYMVKRDPEFLARRLKLKEKERAQRRLLSLAYPVYVAAFVLPGLDRRFGWSTVPVAVEAVGLALALAGYLAILRVFLENRWAGRTVETFEEQQVISTGPYAIVRHPMYTGTLALYLATPLALGSWWALLPTLALIPTFVYRIRNEEEVLLRELPGYEEYRQKVRSRLLPHIW